MKRTVLLALGLLLGGSAHAHENRVSIKVEGDKRIIESNGWPDHEPGQFPNAHNPNTVAEVDHHYEVPVTPQKAEQVTRIGLSPFGVIVNGVPLDPSAAEWWHDDSSSGWQYEAQGGLDLGLDEHQAHVQPNGAYHYHGLPAGVKVTDAADGHSALLGWAADGFPIYGPSGYADPKRPDQGVTTLKPSYRVKSGERPSGPGGAWTGEFTQDWEYVAGLGALDECNGRWAVTPEYPKGTYLYVLTTSFPYIPRCWSGTADASFIRRPPPGGGMGRPGGRRRPRPQGRDDDQSRF